MSSRGIGAGGCLFVIIVIAICVAIGMAFGALAIGAANAWFLSGNFDDGWHLAWAKPWVLLGWIILFLGGTGLSSSARRS